MVGRRKVGMSPAVSGGRPGKVMVGLGLSEDGKVERE